MAINENNVTENILNGIETTYGFTFSAPQRIEAKKVWLVVVTEIMKELKDNADIVLLAGDITVPATGLTAPAGGGAVTGTASIAAATITGKLD